MVKVKSIKPVFNKILVSARKYDNDVKEHGVVVITKGTLMEYQQVVAIGDTVRCVKVGDMIKVNPKRYAVRKHDENSVRNDLNLNPIVGFNFPIIEVDGIDFMYLDDIDVEYVIEDYEEVEDDNSGVNLILPKTEVIV